MNKPEIDFTKEDVQELRAILSLPQDKPELVSFFAPLFKAVELLEVYNDN